MRGRPRGWNASSADAPLSLSSVCHKLHTSLRNNANLWDRIAQREWTQAKLLDDTELHFGASHKATFFADFAPSLPSGELSGLLPEAELCNFRWCVRQYRRRPCRAAFSRPTIGRLQEDPRCDGGYANFARLECAHQSLMRRLHVLERDIADLGFHVDVIVVPSNEALQDPGWGAIHALYAKGGPGLQAWVKGASQFPLESGAALLGPAGGDIDARWLFHAVGISWTGCHYHSMGGQDDGASETSRWRQVRGAMADQLGLLATIFREAAKVGRDRSRSQLCLRARGASQRI